MVNALKIVSKHFRSKHFYYFGAILVVAIVSNLSFFNSVAKARDINFVIQPILSAKRTVEFYAPLVDYLRETTGEPIKLVTANNFLVYWEIMKKGEKYDVILDAAHFTDYRAKRMGYVVLAKVPDTVSYSLVTGEDEFILDPRELIGQSIATISSPGLGGVRLAQMFPNPLQQPIILETANSLEAINKVLKGQAIGAIIPTPLLNSFSRLNTVTTTDQVPHVAISVAPSVNNRVRWAIKLALVEAAKNEEGQKMLRAINFPGFVDADENVYDGYAKLLDGVWGY